MTSIAALIEALTKYVASARVVTSFDVLGVTIFVYDYFLTLGMEVEFVWSSKWGFMKVLYLLQRYLPFLDSVCLCLMHQLSADIDTRVCLIVERARGWLMIIGFALSELILTLRAWAVWERSMRVGIFLSVLFTLTLAAELAVTRLFLHGLRFSEKPYPEFVGCFITGANHLVSFNWIVLMIYEAVTLVLMIIPAIAAYRNGGNIPFYHVIYRDGLMVYVYLFTFSIINVVVVNTLPEEYIDLLSSVERVLHSMLTSRVILEVRQYISRQSAWKDGLTDLQIDLDASVPEKRFRRPHNRGPLAGERRTPR